MHLPSKQPKLVYSISLDIGISIHFLRYVVKFNITPMSLHQLTERDGPDLPDVLLQFSNGSGFIGLHHIIKITPMKEI